MADPSCSYNAEAVVGWARMRSTEGIRVKFERLAASGMAVADYQDAEVLAFGVLPGETALVEVPKSRKRHLLAKVKAIVGPSAFRVPATEEHYLSCSPWQIIDYATQVDFKKRLLGEIFQKSGIELERFYAADQPFGYRNKLEFSFTSSEENLCLAFFVRGTPFRKLALQQGCLLGSDRMNQAALEILQELRQRRLELGALKSLIVRESKTTAHVIAILLATDETLSLRDFRPAQTSGFVLAYSDPRSPASLLSAILATQGIDHLEERILGFTILYPFDAFFQNNLPMFARALEEIRRHVGAAQKVVELYCGVGVIGLAVSDRAEKVLGVDVAPSAIEFARRNASVNRAGNYEVIERAAEKVAPEVFENTDVLVVDPPRTGLHGKLIGRIHAARPRRIVYLSCNPVTQRRDLDLLRKQYQPRALVGFDFNPQTPHIESLLILDRVRD